MSVWERYSSRSEVRGGTRRGVALKQELRWLEQQTKASLSYHEIQLDDVDTNAIIINSDNLNIKTICVHKGQALKGGSMITWKDNHWLVTAFDANDEVYVKGTMEQCNYLLKWINPEGEIVERWSIVEDGTKLERISIYAIVWRTGNGM